MDRDIIFPVTDDNAKKILDAIGCEEITYKELKTSHDPRKVRKAMQSLDALSYDLNNALAMVGEDITHAFQLIGEVTIIKRYQKKHEGRIKEHVKLSDDVEVVRRNNTTFIRFKTKHQQK